MSYLSYNKMTPFEQADLKLLSIQTEDEILGQINRNTTMSKLPVDPHKVQRKC